MFAGSSFNLLLSPAPNNQKSKVLSSIHISSSSILSPSDLASLPPVFSRGKGMYLSIYLFINLYLLFFLSCIYFYNALIYINLCLGANVIDDNSVSKTKRDD